MKHDRNFSRFHEIHLSCYGLSLNHGFSDGGSFVTLHDKPHSEWSCPTGELLPLSQGSQLKHQSHSKVWHCIFLCRKTISQNMHGINKTLSLQINFLIYRVRVWALMGLYHSIQRCVCLWALWVYLPYVCGRERLKLSRQEQFSVLELVFLLFWRWRLLGLLFKVS